MLPSQGAQWCTQALALLGIKLTVNGSAHCVADAVASPALTASSVIACSAATPISAEVTGLHNRLQRDVLLTSLCPRDAARVRSCSGPVSGLWCTA
eukprot:11685597-Alexandrium_andersonii.AAC.1